MLGAIIGDIVGSRFEFNNHRSKEFDLFGKGCFATDDSIMTLAVAKAIMETERAAAYMSENSDGAEVFRALLCRTLSGTIRTAGMADGSISGCSVITRSRIIVSATGCDAGESCRIRCA